MSAKSFAVTPPPVSPMVPLPRRLMTLVLFLASFSALILLLSDDRYGTSLKSAFAVVQEEAHALSDLVLPVPAPQLHPDHVRHQALAEYLARRYKVAQEQTLEFVRIAHAEGARIGLDPLLVMAVISVESRFNPIAESVAGAKGLMQIIPRFHVQKLAEFGGERAVFDPEPNIRVGTRILKEYLNRTGNLGIALQMYAGALGDDNDTYTTKVLGEKQRLQQVVAANVERSVPARPLVVTRGREVRSSMLGG